LPLFVYSKLEKMIFGNSIRKLREKKGLLLRQLAAKLEVDTATISKIERGTRCAKKEQLIKLSKILETPYNQLETLWLADKLYGIIEYEENGLQALKLAEQEVKYKSV